MAAELFALAEQERISVWWWDFEPPVKGLYWAPPGVAPLIALDHSLAHNTPLLRTVCAEELGHHFTTASAAICRTYCNYRDRLFISKAEYRALRWAARYLMPKHKLEQAFRDGCIEVWSLAEWFRVTEEMVRFRLDLPGTFIRHGRP